MPNVSPVFILKTKNAAGLVIQAATRAYRFVGQVLLTDLGSREVEVDVGASNSQSFYLADDWINTLTSGILGWDNQVSGVGGSVTISATGDEKHWGIVRLSSEAVNSRAAILLDTAAFTLGNANIVINAGVRIVNLSTAIDEGIFRIGLGDNPAADYSDGVYFEYNRSVSLNWILKTANGGVRTSVITSIPVTASPDWFNLRLVITPASVNYYINDVLAGNIATNLPSTLVRTGPIATVNKSIGSASTRAVDVDYYSMSAQFIAPRY